MMLLRRIHGISRIDMNSNDWSRGLCGIEAISNIFKIQKIALVGACSQLDGSRLPARLILTFGSLLIEGQAVRQPGRRRPCRD